MKIIRFRDSESKVVFDYPKALALSGDADRVVFLSQRDYYLLLNSIEYIGKFRNRVYTSKTDELYEICSDDQWAIFQGWVEQLETNLGGWPLANEYLERIAIATESLAESQAFIAENTYEKVTWQDVINDLEATLGVSNILYLVVKEITDLIPSLRIKLDGNQLIGMFWTMMTWNAPMMAAAKTIAAAQTAQTALMGTAKTASILGAVLTGFGSLTNYYQGVRDAIFGGWSIMDFIAGLLTYLIPDSEGGTGGGDPDNDPTNRTIVNITVNNPSNEDLTAALEAIAAAIGDSMPIINITCGSCGSSGGCGCGGGGGAHGPGVNGPGDQPPIENVPGEIPHGFPDSPTYNVYKCKASNVLVLNLAELLYQIGSKENANLSQYTTYQAAGASLGIQTSLILYSGGVAPAGLAEWLTEQIMGFLWPYPSSAAVGLAIFEGIRLELLTDRAEAVCELYNADDTGEARDALETRIDGYIDSTSYTSEVKVKAKEMYKGLLSNAFLNRLFQKDSAINVYSDSSSIDCSECASGLVSCLFGEDVAQEVGEVDISSTPTSGGHYVSIGFSEPTNVTVSLLSGSLTEPFDFLDCWTEISTTSACCGGGCLNPCWTTIEPTHELGTHNGIMGIQYRSGDPFRLRFTFSE